MIAFSGLAREGGRRRAGDAENPCMLTTMAEENNTSVGEALSWASRLIAIGILMFLPAVAGNWADARLGTSWLGLTGLVAGFVLGLVGLVRITAGRGRR